MHLCTAMLLPRPEAHEQSRRFAETGKLEFEGATLERHGKAALVTMRNPRFLNAEDETTIDGLEIAIDVATLDPKTDIAVLRGDVVDHSKYRGRGCSPRASISRISITARFPTSGTSAATWASSTRCSAAWRARAKIPTKSMAARTEKPWMA